MPKILAIDFKSVAKDGGKTDYRGQVRFGKNSVDSKSQLLSATRSYGW